MTKGLFAQWVIAQRGSHNEVGFVSQQELADRMGVTVSTVAKMENSPKTPGAEVRARVHCRAGAGRRELPQTGLMLARVEMTQLRGTKKETADADGR